MLFFPGVCACVGGVRTVQRAQDLPIAIVEEIAFENGWITRGQLMVRGALRQEPLRPAFEGPRRRRDHARAESEELT